MVQDMLFVVPVYIQQYALNAFGLMFSGYYITQSTNHLVLMWHNNTLRLHKGFHNMKTYAMKSHLDNYYLAF